MREDSVGVGGQMSRRKNHLLQRGILLRREHRIWSPQETVWRTRQLYLPVHFQGTGEEIKFKGVPNIIQLGIPLPRPSKGMRRIKCFQHHREVLRRLVCDGFEQLYLHPTVPVLSIPRNPDAAQHISL